MRKLNLLSNSRIVLFIKNDEWVEIKPEQIPGLKHANNEGYASITIRPDQIPTEIFDAIVNAASNEIVLSLSIFLNVSFDNYAKFIMTTWDGVSAIKRKGKLFGDGSFEFTPTNSEGSMILGIL